MNNEDFDYSETNRNNKSSKNATKNEEIPIMK